MSVMHTQECLTSFVTIDGRYLFSPHDANVRAWNEGRKRLGSLIKSVTACGDGFEANFLNSTKSFGRKKIRKHIKV
jgi:hypothetical protein